MTMLGRALPYLLSWGVLVVLMIIGMKRMPLALYTPIDGEWAKWNVEAILHFGKVFDLSPYSMLAGMGSMYFPTCPGSIRERWRSGCRSTTRKNIASYAIYAAELAVSIVVLARVIGFSWLMSTAAAQLYLYLLFPPFSEVFRIYDWYLARSLLCASAGGIEWRNGAACLSAGVSATGGESDAWPSASSPCLFPGSFRRRSPSFSPRPPMWRCAAAFILTRRPSLAEWAWKIAALRLCLMFFFSVRSPRLLSRHHRHGRPHTRPRIAWDRLLSAGPGCICFGITPICSDPRLLLCIRKSRRVAADRRALRGGRGHRHASRRHPRRCRGFDRVYRPRARLCLCLSGRLAWPGRACSPAIF